MHTHTHTLETMDESAASLVLILFVCALAFVLILAYLYCCYWSNWADRIRRGGQYDEEKAGRGGSSGESMSRP